jgi:hypothetical protein
LTGGWYPRCGKCFTANLRGELAAVTKPVTSVVNAGLAPSSTSVSSDVEEQAAIRRIAAMANGEAPADPGEDPEVAAYLRRMAAYDVGGAA